VRGLRASLEGSSESAGAAFEDFLLQRACALRASIHRIYGIVLSLAHMGLQELEDWCSRAAALYDPDLWEPLLQPLIAGNGHHRREFESWLLRQGAEAEGVDQTQLLHCGERVYCVHRCGIAQQHVGCASSLVAMGGEGVVLRHAGRAVKYLDGASARQGLAHVSRVVARLMKCATAATILHVPARLEASFPHALLESEYLGKDWVHFPGGRVCDEPLLRQLFDFVRE
jgi:hypothetical protein